MLKKIMVVLSICISIVLSGCTAKEEGKFTVGNMSTEHFPSGEPYFLVVPIEWSGSQPAVIDSISIEVDGEEIRETEGIDYEFYSGRPDKPIGVYPEYAIGGKENIQGYEIKHEGILIMKVIASNAHENEKRRMNITYSVNGNKKEQTISTTTVEGLSTKRSDTLEHILLNETMNKPATEAEIARVEETLGRQLPADFIQLLKTINGGTVNDMYQAFPVDFPIESGDGFIDINEIMGTNEEGLMLSDYFIQEWDLPKGLVLFSGSGHAWVGFNYENRETPNVVYVEPDDGNGNNFHVLADNFTEFVSQLTEAE